MQPVDESVQRQRSAKVVALGLVAAHPFEQGQGLGVFHAFRGDEIGQDDESDEGDVQASQGPGAARERRQIHTFRIIHKPFGLFLTHTH